MDELLTRQEVAAVLGVSVDTLDKRCLGGDWPCRRLGPRLVRFTLDDVDEIIRRSHNEPPPPIPTKENQKRGQFATYSPPQKG